MSSRKDRLEYYQQLIEQILDEQIKQRGITGKEQIILYKMGYLMGWLAMSADDHSIVGEQIRKRMNKIDPTWSKNN
jgi:hypothetical protein